jgi:hypothetical protein
VVVVGRLGEDSEQVQPVARRKDLVGVRAVGDDCRVRREQAHEQRRAGPAEARDDEWLELRLE